MRKYKGTIELARVIEDHIRNNTEYIDYHKVETEMFQSNMPSKVFSRHYQIYLEVKDNSELSMLLHITPSAIIRFIYNYRDLASEIKISTPDFELLFNSIPKLKNLLFEYNQKYFYQCQSSRIKPLVSPT